jgi:hypothetical protein
VCQDENGNPAPLPDVEMKSLWRQAKEFAHRKINEQQQQQVNRVESSSNSNKKIP